MRSPGPDSLCRLQGSQPPPSCPFLSSAYFLSSSSNVPHKSPAFPHSPTLSPNLKLSCPTPTSILPAPPPLPCLFPKWIRWWSPGGPSLLCGLRLSLKLFQNLYQFPGSQPLRVQPFPHPPLSCLHLKGGPWGWRVRWGTHLEQPLPIPRFSHLLDVGLPRL